MEEFIKKYENIKKYKNIVVNIDKDYFFKFADYMINKYAELEEIEKEHSLKNGELRNLLDEYEKQIDLDYVDKNYVSRAKILKIKEEKLNKIEKLHPGSDIVLIDDLENQIKILDELLEE